MKTPAPLFSAALAALLAGATGAFAAPSTDADRSAAALELLKSSVAYRTVKGEGQVPHYAQFLKDTLVAAGFPAADIEVQPYGETAALVARYRGSNPKAKPLLVSVHMDVVAALASDWGRDPFTPVIENGYLIGRGSEDNKFDLAMIVTTIARLKQEGYVPYRDIVLVFSGDEETEMLTTRALAKQFPDAWLLLNGDGGGGGLDTEGKPIAFYVQAGEKTYADFEITFTNPGGHSSRPTKDNAIADVAEAVRRIRAYQFPVQSNEITLASFKASGPRTPGSLGEAMTRFAADPTDAAAIATISADSSYVGQIRTTCVPTMIRGGHAHNALPQSATVSVNCRIFPGVSIESVKDSLAKAVDLPGATIAVIGDPTASDASPLNPELMAAVRKAVDTHAPGIPIVPSMSSGATDSLHFRAQGVPSYGVAGLFMRDEDGYAHGLNERAPISSIDGALKHWYSLLKTLGDSKTGG